MAVATFGASTYGLMQFPEGQIVGFGLVLLRMMAFIFAMPLFGAGSVPAPVKVLFSIALTVIIAPLAVTKAASSMAVSEDVILWAARELTIGIFLGFLMRMYFFAVSVAGEMIGISSGLATAQIFNPSLGATSNVIEQLQIMMATLLFLALNGHHFFIEGVMKSFETLPIGIFSLNLDGFQSAGAMLRDVTIFGLKIAAPIMVSIFLTHLAMGILGKAVPQINVLVTSLQVTIIVTFIVMIVAIPANTTTMTEMMSSMAGDFMRALKTL